MTLDEFIEEFKPNTITFEENIAVVNFEFSPRGEITLDFRLPLDEIYKLNVPQVYELLGRMLMNARKSNEP